jgi:multidrug resistance efflux pump
MQGSAPVYSLADEAHARAEAAAWSRFTTPADADEFCASWLALLCARIERCRAALLLVGEEEHGPYRVGAVWPDRRRDLQHLGPAGQRALTERAGVVIAAAAGAPASDALSQVAYPVEVSGRLWGAVVIELGPSAEAELQRALRSIHWGIAWLVDHFRQRLLAEREATLARVDLLNDLVATALQHGRLEPSALAVVNQLAQCLQCDRVSMGLERNGHVAPLALSHTATFDARSDLVRWLGDAMDEVLDLGVPVRHPPTAADELGAIAHGEVARELKVEAICSVPLLHEGQTVGALVFERNAGPPFDDRTQLLARTAGELLGPVWALLRDREKPWWQRLRESLRSFAVALAGPRYPGLKLLAATAALLLAVLTFWHIDYRVSARTVVEGSQQIAAVAPFEGFVAQALARAGDTVHQGQPLARLDDRDLKLEAARWRAEREQLLRRFQVAQAAQDRGAMGVITAQIGQAQAQLALVQERLARATLVAPYDGIVVSGDLSQQIGSPVEQGRVLFEVAPTAGYRVILQVDERDISRLSLGQRGELVLSGLPGQALPITVHQITPVSTAQDGRNFFRVEAQLEGTAPRLRPGMEGVGKVSVGEERLIWIWTHGFTDWLRLTLWNWMP